MNPDDTPIWTELEPRWRQIMSLGPTPPPARTTQGPPGRPKKPAPTPRKPAGRTGAPRAVQSTQTGGES